MQRAERPRRGTLGAMTTSSADKVSMRAVRVTAVAAAVVLLLASMTAAYRLGEQAGGGAAFGADTPPAAPLPPEISAVADLFARIQTDAVDTPGEDELLEGALTGMLDTLDDDYAMYYDAEAFSAFNQQLDGEFSGVGMVLEELPDGLTVVTVLPDSPAQAAGIRSGQRVVSVDGDDVTALPIESVVEIVKGEAGTDVTLGLDGDGPAEVTLTRAVIALPTLESELRADGVGHVRLLQFSARSGEEVSRAVRDLTHQGAAALVLDLRGNPGGLLSEAIEVTSVFAEAGVVVSVEERGQEPQAYQVDGDAVTDLPVAVLVDAGSASASEIVAAALQELDRATVVGQTTFGKGTVQTVRLLGDGSGVKFTTARYYTPSGESIEGVGVVPDRTVAAGAEAVDVAADIALQAGIAGDPQDVAAGAGR